MPKLIQEKLQQAVQLVKASTVDVWLTFVRETSDGTDPVLPFILEGSLTWISALMISKTGEKVAIVGTYDADALKVTGDWDKVATYDEDIRPVLTAELERLCPASPKIGINFSVNDEKCDGITHGMFLLLEAMLKECRFEGCLVSAEAVCMALRSQKTPNEVQRMQQAILAGDAIFEDIGNFAKLGTSELELYHHVQALIDERGLGYSWDRTGDPIVNFGPHSTVGHGRPSSAIRLERGHILHVDLGVILQGYSSDIQRCWFVGSEIPPIVQKGFERVKGAIQAAFDGLRPGRAGWEIDLIARNFLIEGGYPEYKHALGHQVGRVAHDGGALLGPRWARYGDRPIVPISEGEVYTLELGAMVEGHGYISLEEMVQITENGAVWLSQPQLELWLLDL